jgi:sugar fermentation stimulation protein A
VGRKTGYNLILAEKNGVLVSVDSMAPNRVVGEALGSGLITEMGGLSVVRREPTYGGSRLDFLLGDGSARLLLEVKSCTLVEEGVALFPDAPTERGTRHLKTLESFLREGRASVLFLIQKELARAVALLNNFCLIFVYVVIEIAYLLETELSVDGVTHVR